MLDSISRKIEELGGLKKSTSKSTPEWDALAHEGGISVPELVELIGSLIGDFGDSYFLSEVGFTSITNLPAAFQRNGAIIGKFLGWTGDQDDIIRTYLRFRNQIDKKFLPFAEGESGDYLTIKLKGKDAGSIWYWHHESPEGEDLFLVATDFEKFILGLKPSTRPKADTSGFLGSKGNTAFWERMKKKRDELK